MSSEPVETVWQGKFIAAKRQGKWEYVSRIGGVRAAVILAIDGGDVILVEQYRVPLGKACLELPAGLVGDLDAGESVEQSARRELEEETGYRAGRIEALGEFYSTPGLASEGFTLVRATELSRVGDGGGDADENIVVHRVALAQLEAFVAAKRAEGCGVDVKLLLLLGAGIVGGG
ncbi:NUDIX hydrolase [Sphingomonas koreensis]|nr:NUDIX hydrolase [Sphingomonas koreensis]